MRLSTTRRPRAALWLAAFAVAQLALGHASRPARATQVTALAAEYHDGQTFLTWTCPPGTGSLYRAYASALPIDSPAALRNAALLGAVGDSTWYDRRLSVVRNKPYAFCIDSAGAPLTPAQGLFVVTCGQVAGSYYAVTVQDSAGPEDSTITLGQNSLTAFVAEGLDLPRPVYQRTVYESSVADIYTLWTSSGTRPRFPAMANRASQPFDCAVVRGTPGSPLFLRAHARWGNMLQALDGSGTPGEWVLSLDDPVQAPEGNTMFFGYHSAFNILAGSPPPDTGTVVDYTMRRVIYTVEWARRTFPADVQRTYFYGISMGATCGVFLGLERPDLVAATWAMLPKFDFSYPDVDGSLTRWATDDEWGRVPSNLPTDTPQRVYQRMNAGYMAGVSEAQGMPPLFALSGRNDVAVGWAEKIPFYQSSESNLQSGCYFWDTRGHTIDASNYWGPMESPAYLYRFRLDRSFPALSRCTADGNPGDGTAVSGDSVGTLNGAVEWDTTLTDTPAKWEVQLHTRDLDTHTGVLAAPESCTVNVTPRRLQAFRVVPSTAYLCTVTRLADGVVVQSEVSGSDAQGLVTATGVRVYRGGSRLAIQPLVPAAAGGPSAAGALRVAVLQSPVSGPSRVSVRWPAAGRGRVDLVGPSGRVVRTLARGAVAPGEAQLRLDPAGLPSGIYFLVARLGAQRATARVVLLR